MFRFLLCMITIFILKGCPEKNKEELERMKKDQMKQSDEIYQRAKKERLDNLNKNN